MNEKPRFPLEAPTNRQIEMLRLLFDEKITNQEFRDFLEQDMPDSVSKDRILAAFDGLIRLESGNASFEEVVEADNAIFRLEQGDD